jgi:uncharacterized Zn-binding protein involved in type VI secretion
MIMCPVPQATPAALPHAPAGLPIIPPGGVTVLIGGQPAARVGDFSLCIAPAPVPNPVLRGSFPVPIQNMPAARMTDQGTHPGSMIMPPCCPTVLIGLAGTAGNVMAGTQACQAAAAGRTSGSTQQSYNNCGVESSRQVINRATGANISEDALLTASKNNPAINTGPPAFPTPLGPPGSPNVFAHGGTYPSNQAALLGANGVPATVGSTATTNGMEMAMSQGRGTLVNIDAAALWPTTAGNSPAAGAWHVVTVTGIEYDDNGNITNYIINDTGTAGGNCGVRVPKATFEGAAAAYHTPGQGMVTTNNAIW